MRVRICMYIYACMCLSLPGEGGRYNNAVCYLKLSLIQSKMRGFLLQIAYTFESVVNEKYFIINALAACIENERQLGRTGIVYMKCISA